MDDEEWAAIQRCQKGDHAAFRSLVESNQRMIHAIAFRMTGSMADADDLAQETFILAFRRLNTFRGDSAFSSWLYRIAMNLCINWQKQEVRRHRLHENWERPEVSENASDTALGQQVQVALMKLAPKLRATVVLTIYDGRSHAEAAEILGCSETTVSWRMFMAKRKLKVWLSTEKAKNE